jgi:TetR/AcrR family transcriptional regulator, transcriptional repressor for nem operon
MQVHQHGRLGWQRHGLLESLVMSKMSSTGESAPGDEQQARIVEVAARLFIAHGYNGVSYLNIARELGISHSNIHYYFRVKSMLAEAVLRQVADATLQSMQRIWLDSTTSLLEKCIGTRNWMYEHYLQFNPSGKGGQSWGLLARFTMDADVLSMPMKRVMRSTLQRLEDYIAAGVRLAVESGELVEDAPQAGITLQISSLLSVSGQATRSASGFDRLDELIKWTYTSIRRAYCRPDGTQLQWPEPKVP